MWGLRFLRDACASLATQLISHLKCRLCFYWGVLAREKTFIWSRCVSWVLPRARAHACVCVCVLRSCPHMMLLPCHACVRQQLHVWLQLECVCGLNSVCVFARWNGMHVYRVAERGRVAACRDDGIGKRSLSLRPTAKPAGGATAIYSLSLSLSLCRSLSPSLCLSRSLAGSVFSAQSLFFFFCFLTSECIPFISFCPSRNLFSAVSPPRARRPDVFPPRFLSILFSLCSSFLLLLLVFPDVTWLLSLFTPLTSPISITDKVCVKLEVVTQYWNEKLELKLTNFEFTHLWCRLYV